MNHFGMLNKEPFHIIMDATTAAPKIFVRDDNGQDDLSFFSDNFAIPGKEDVVSDEDMHNKKTSVGRKGSNGSPVCVSSFFDDFMGCFTNSGFDNEEDLIVNDNTFVYRDSVEEDESMEFTDPDKLEKAISELCEPILKKERQHVKSSKASSLVGKDIVFKKAKVSTKNVLQAKINKSFVPLFIMSSQLDVNDQGIMISHTVDDDIAMHPVTPEYQRSTGDTYGEFGPAPQMAAQRQLFLPTVPKSARCFAAPSSIVRMPMMPHDEEAMLPTQRSLLFLSSVKDCATPTTSMDETTAIEAAMRDTNENRIIPRMLFVDGSGGTEEHQQENWSCPVQDFNKVCKDADSWERYFSIAKEFRQLHGHCCIPYKYPQDRKFAAWAKRQRYQYTLYKRQQEKIWKPDDKKTALTEERIDALNSIDFIWDIQEAQFELFLVAYRKFQEENGNISVPKKYKDGLGRWVGSQRSTLRKGKMPLDRFVKLERIGFLWSSHGDPSGELLVQLEKMRGKSKLASANARFK